MRRRLDGHTDWVEQNDPHPPSYHPWSDDAGGLRAELAETFSMAAPERGLVFMHIAHPGLGDDEILIKLDDSGAVGVAVMLRSFSDGDTGPGALLDRGWAAPERAGFLLREWDRGWDAYEVAGEVLAAIAAATGTDSVRGLVMSGSWSSGRRRVVLSEEEITYFDPEQGEVVEKVYRIDKSVLASDAPTEVDLDLLRRGAGLEPPEDDGIISI